MRIPRPATIVLALVALTLTGLIVARVSAQADNSPTEHPPIIVPSSSVDPSPTPSSKADDDDDDDDDRFEKIQPRPRDIGDDDDDDRDEPGDD